MRCALLILMVGSAWAQVAKPEVPEAGVTAGMPIGPKIVPQSFTALEDRFDAILRGLPDPIDVIGETRAIYLRDYGLVITTKISPVVAQGMSPFLNLKQIPKERIASIHGRMLEQVPRLKQTMREFVRNAALNLSAAIGTPQYEKSPLQVAVAVRLVYLPWEDTTGLPAQIIMKATLKNAIALEIQEEQH